MCHQKNLDHYFILIAKEALNLSFLFPFCLKPLISLSSFHVKYRSIPKYLFEWSVYTAFLYSFLLHSDVFSFLLEGVVLAFY